MAVKSDILKRFSDNLFFRLSLASQELFHLNFWSWLLDDDIRWLEFADVFGFSPDNKPEIVCNEKSYPLLFKFNEDVCIIDTKLKSIPNKEQLEASFADAFEKGLNPTSILLVTLADLNYNDTQWHFEDDFDYTKSYDIEIKYLTYEELLTKFYNKNSEAFYIQEYIKYLELLKDLKSLYFWDEKSLCNDFCKFYENIKKDLTDLDLSEIFQKVSLSNLANKILENQPYKNDVKIVINHSEEDQIFNMEFWFKANDRLIEDIGITVIGNEIRHCAYIFKDNDEAKSSDIKKKYSEKLLNSKFKEFFPSVIKNSDYQLYTMLYTREENIEGKIIFEFIQKIRNELMYLYGVINL